MENDLRTRVARFLKECYEGGEGVPPISKILRELGIYRRAFYATFPKGLEQACELAGVPFPRERAARTRRALEARPRRRPTGLPEDLLLRLQAAAEAEGKDPSAMLASLLDAHSLLRRHGLSNLEGTVKAALRAKELGVPGLSEGEFEALRELARKVREEGWGISEFVAYAAANYTFLEGLKQCLRGKAGYGEYLSLLEGVR